MRAPDRLAAVMDELAAKASEESRAGMARYGINVDGAYGVLVYELRRMAKTLGTDHELALALETAEAILASAEARAAADRKDSAARSARWVAREALRELRSEKTLRRLKR